MLYAVNNWFYKAALADILHSVIRLAAPHSAVESPRDQAPMGLFFAAASKQERVAKWSRDQEPRPSNGNSKRNANILNYMPVVWKKKAFRVCLFLINFHKKPKCIEKIAEHHYRIYFYSSFLFPSYPFPSFYCIHSVLLRQKVENKKEGENSSRRKGRNVLFPMSYLAWITFLCQSYIQARIT